MSTKIGSVSTLSLPVQNDEINDVINEVLNTGVPDETSIGFFEKSFSRL